MAGGPTGAQVLTNDPPLSPAAVPNLNLVPKLRSQDSCMHATCCRGEHGGRAVTLTTGAPPSAQPQVVRVGGPGDLGSPFFLPACQSLASILPGNRTMQ